MVPSTRAAVYASLFTLIAVGLRIHNAFTYPPDWGFDATFNWRYILQMSENWEMPAPDAGWSTSDPPLFFALSAALWNAFDHSLVAIPLMNTALGLMLIALAVALVRSLEPHSQRRAILAGGLLLFLPAHIHMSVMVNEGMLAALLASTALFLLTVGNHRGHGRGSFPLREGVGVGLASGLAALTKLAGLLSAMAAVASYALAGLRSRNPGTTAMRIAVTLLVVGLTGGWFYARNQILYGYIHPQNLPVHQIMVSMPPGERSIRDYFYVPISTFSDPQLLNTDLLRSVWGSTYATTWFDGHRYILPGGDRRVTRLGTLTLLLALFPTLAFGAGLLRGARRAARDPTGPDTPLVVFTGLTLAGYAYFTWVNPWFAVVKGTSLLALSLPFSVYASEILSDWTRPTRARAAVVWGALAALALCVVLTSTFDLAFEKREVSGLVWSPTSQPQQP